MSYKLGRCIFGKCLNIRKGWLVMSKLLQGERESDNDHAISSFNGSVVKGGGKSEKKNSVRVSMKAIPCSHFLSDWAFLYNLI